MYNLLLIIYIKFYIILYNQIKDCDIVWNYYYIWSQYKENFDDFAKEWKMAIFCIKIVEACFNYFNIEQEIAGTGRPPFDLILMVKLNVYACLNGITSSEQISINAEHHELYKFVSNHLMPAGRTIRKYRFEYEGVFRKITSFTLIIAYAMDLTDFEHISIRWYNYESFQFSILCTENGRN